MSTTTPIRLTCPSWCVRNECNGDHWVALGSADWPRIRATAWPAGGAPLLCPHPTWGQIDGLQPAVALWLEGSNLDTTIDLTPTEAREVGRRLFAAADVAESTEAHQ